MKTGIIIILFLCSSILLCFTIGNSGRSISKEEIQNWSDQQKLKYVKECAEFFLADFRCDGCTETTETIVLKFFQDSRLNVLETAIMEELKYGIPAEVKIAQAAIETGWGKNVKGNNWFGIKGSDQIITTKEYLNADQLHAYNIVHKTQIKPDLYLCVVKDSFSNYATSWESWRAHSEYIYNRKKGDEYRYRDLIGKSWEVWCDSLAKRGYATDIKYSSKLKSIIKKYKLYKL